MGKLPGFLSTFKSIKQDQSKNLIVESIEFNRTPIEWLVFDCRIQLNANRIQKKCKNLIAFDCIWLPSITFDYIQLYPIKFFYKCFLILAYNPWPWRCWSNLASPIGYIWLHSVEFDCIDKCFSLAIFVLQAHDHVVQTKIQSKQCFFHSKSKSNRIK